MNTVRRHLTTGPVPPSQLSTGRGRQLLGAAVAVVLGLAGCSTGETAQEPASTTSPVGDVFGHVHGVATDPGSGEVLVAAHNGLFRLGESGTLVPLGPSMDLMGFAVAGPDRFLASGHPSPGQDLPQPLGLIESRDGGRSWSRLSRGGQSDFHALATHADGIYGYDGTLVSSTDGLQWTELPVPTPAYVLTTSPDGQVLVIGDALGLTRSADAGSTWSPVADSPLLQVVDWSDTGDDAVGIGVDGVTWRTSDAGLTWRPAETLTDAAQAVEVRGSGTTLEVTVVTTRAVLQSTDGGATFVHLASTD